MRSEPKRGQTYDARRVKFRSSKTNLGRAGLILMSFFVGLFSAVVDGVICGIQVTRCTYENSRMLSFDGEVAYQCYQSIPPQQFASDGSTSEHVWRHQQDSNVVSDIDAALIAPLSTRAFSLCRRLLSSQLQIPASTWKLLLPPSLLSSAVFDADSPAFDTESAEMCDVSAEVGAELTRVEDRSDIVDPDLAAVDA
jgi:hypothetical protein